MHPIRTEAGYRAIFKVEAAGIALAGRARAYKLAPFARRGSKAVCFHETPRSPLVRTGRGFNSATSAINKNAPRGGVFVDWWRRRELNPRPQVLYRWFYILSRII